jgi:hypothetical protein
VKSNLGPPPDSLAYRLVEAGDYGVAVVKWVGHTQHTARSLLSDHQSRDDDIPDVETWLKKLLKDGRIKATDVYAAADAAGFSKDKAKRAKKALGVGAVKDDCWYWALEDEGSEPDDDTPPEPQNGTPLHSYSLAGQVAQNHHHEPQGSKGATDRVAWCGCGGELRPGNNSGLCAECALERVNGVEL